jgi:hypothetical protein
MLSMKKTESLALLLATALLALTSSAQSGSESSGGGSVRGVNPADNLTKFELLPKFTRADEDNDISITTLTLKYDRAIQGVWGLNLELPLARFDSPFGDDTGVGDLNIRGRRQFRAGRWTYIAGLEAVVPIASADTLGTGKLQLNPTAVAVYAVSSQTFVAGVAKQLLSVAGEGGRGDIVQGQFRLLVAHSTKTGWWILGDPQLWVDYDRDARSQFSLDLEVGRMVRPLTGMWIRAGSRLGGNWHKDDWSVSAGIRFISF